MDVNYADSASGKTTNGVYYADCTTNGYYINVGPHAWSTPAYSDNCTSTIPGTRSVRYAESLAVTANGVPACAQGYTWMADPNGFGYYYWKAFNVSGSIVDSHWSAASSGQAYWKRCVFGTAGTPPDAY